MAKIEPRLAEEIRRIEASPTPDVGIPVLFELSGEPASAGGLAEMEGRVRSSQAPVLQSLAEIGASAQASTLANTISTVLPTRQIAAVAKLPEVKRVIWNRVEQVTA